jgi:hypothetical protein
MTSQTEGRCLATTHDGSQCSNPAEQGSEYCHISSHGPDGSQDGATDDEEWPPTDPTFYEGDEGRAMLAAAGRSPEDKQKSVSSYAAQTLLQKTADGSPSATDYIRMFDSCAVEGCDNGCDSFESQTCFDHSEEDTSSSNDGGDGDGNTITVTVNGNEVTGTPEEVKALTDL